MNFLCILIPVIILPLRLQQTPLVFQLGKKSFSSPALKLADKGGAALQSQMSTELPICPEHSSHPSCQGQGGHEGNS